MKILINIPNRKKLYLSKRVSIQIFKRFYPGPERGHAYKVLEAVTNNLFKKVPSANMQHSVALLQERLLINKLVFLKFCNHFKEIPLNNLMNDSIFIEWVHKSIHENPTLYSRAFQLSLEVIYHKRHFSEEKAYSFYEKDFIIKDVFKINKGVCDHSTLYSAASAFAVKDYFNLEFQDIIVNSTPLFLKKESITPELQKIMDYNKKLTGNSAPDVTIKGRPYDFKESNDTAWSKNNIKMVELETYHQHYSPYAVKRLEDYFKNQIKVSPSLEYRSYANTLLNILQNKSRNHDENLTKMYKYVFKNEPPEGFGIPLIFPLKKATSNELKNFFSKEEINKVQLDSGTLTDVKAKKAIESIQKDWDLDLKEKVKKAMTGCFSHVLQNQSNDDIS